MVGIPGHFKAGAKVVPKSLTQAKRIVRAPQLHLAPSDDQVLHCIILETGLITGYLGSRVYHVEVRDHSNAGIVM